ncbi:MAG: nickel pincer cofactor biosynthesis protein LarC [Nitrospirota bacterium]
MAIVDAYLDCFAGICGNMLLGALVDVGVAFDELRDAIAALGMGGYDLTCERRSRGGIATTHVRVTCGAQPHHRRLADCLRIIGESSLPQPVQADAARTFTHLAEAEAAIHGVTIDEVHFHEVGAVDAIVDIVGACWALHRLGVRHLSHGPVNLGDGTVACLHGTYPVPVPAVQRLLLGRSTRRGIPGVSTVGELTTPTGAALLSALARPVPEGITQTAFRTGYGAGDRDPDAFPNCLRIELHAVDRIAARREPVVELVCDVDDLNPECLPAVDEAARRAGALDVTMAAVTGKSGRPATRLTALCRPAAAAAAVEAALFRHTTTFGVRRRDVTRTRLIRRCVETHTPFGTVRIKEGWLDGERLQASPEYRDCLAHSRDHDVPVREVYRAALQCIPPPGAPPDEDDSP